MQNVPKIVSQRLRAMSGVAEHPDADMLAAFVDRSLTERESSGVLEHLARCRDCRDIVALALPPVEAAGAAVVRERRGWLTWPALRWGFAAAGVIAIASFGVVEYQRQMRPQVSVAREWHPEAIAKYAEAQPPAANSAAAAKTTGNAMHAVAPSVAAGQAKQMTSGAAAARISSRRESEASGARSRGDNALTDRVSGLQQNAQLASDLKAKSLPPSQTVEVAAASPAVEVNPSPSSSEAEASNASPAATGQAAGLLDDSASRVDKAKPAMTTLRPTPLPMTIPRWTISSAGGLQRSFDQGNTWQDVNVTANPAAPASGAGFVRRALGERVEEKKSQNADKNAAPVPVAAILFRAVAANGADVWAGGSDGALFHSVDAGNHWAQVVPFAAGAALTGDVIGLQFPDAQHAKVTTSTSETWITPDDGLTWQKQ